MENINQEQIYRGQQKKINSLELNKTNGNTDGNSGFSLKEAFVYEKKKRSLLNTQIEAIKAQLKKLEDEEAKDLKQSNENEEEIKNSIKNLELQIAKKQEEIALKKQQLEGLISKSTELNEKYKKHFSTKFIINQIDKTTSSINSLKKELENDVDNIREVQEVKMRSSTLFQIKNSEIDVLSKNKKSILELINKMVNESDNNVKNALRISKSIIDSPSPYIQQTQIMQKRCNELLESINLLTSGQQIDELAETINRKMRQRLLRKYMCLK